MRATLLFALLCLASPAIAAPYDLIYSDRVDVTLCEGCGITLAGVDFGILVNTGALALGTDSLSAARFTATSSEPTLTLQPLRVDVHCMEPDTCLPGKIIPCRIQCARSSFQPSSTTGPPSLRPIYEAPHDVALPAKLLGFSEIIRLTCSLQNQPSDLIRNRLLSGVFRPVARWIVA